MPSYFNSTIISDHNIHKAINANIYFASQITDPDTGTIIPIQVSEKDQEIMNYANPVNDKLSNLSAVYTEIEYIKTKLREFMESNENNPEPPDLFISYHYKNWLIRIVSLLDINLHLINEVMDLGYFKMNVLEFLKNKHICKESQLVIKLREFNGILESNFTTPAGLKNIRNKIIHAGEFEHPLISEAFMNTFFNLGVDKDGEVVTYDFACNSILKFILESENKIISTQRSILDCLYPITLRTLKAIENKQPR